MSADTPMFRQYRELKAVHPDALLFFRMGDFWELFGEDAVWTAAALELTLTTRDRNDPEPIPMCGVPVHAVDGYLKRLVELGRKVALADQVEDPKLAKGLVRRDIVRVVTPGLAADVVESRDASWLVAIGGGPGAYGLALLDASTGDWRATTLRDMDGVIGELARFEPREALLAPETDDPEIRAALGTLCVTVAEAFPGAEPDAAAADALLAYARSLLRSRLPNVGELRRYVVGQGMALDEATRRNLELFRPLRGTGRVGTLLWLLDECRTAMGSRRLREWIGAPLLDLQAIADRQDAVEAFVAGGREEAREALRPVADLERLCARVVQGTASPRDLAALRFSLEALPALGGACRAPALARRIPEDLAPDVAADIAAWLVDEPPALTGDGGYIRDGADEALDRVRGLALDARGAIARMEDALRAETGVASLKIRYNSVFGYYIEVTKANLHRVPGRWHRKQTIATGERFITPELKEYEEQVAGAESRRVAMEAEFLLSLRARVGAQVGRLQALARAVGELDVFAALAEVAARWRWTRPEVDRGDGLELRAARHPVVEAARREERFVPNDLALDENSRLIILTGPNMAGKSTLMRQAALAVVLAQVGSFVPAQRARVGLVDRLFVRVGASDDLAKGQSTFMVEMSETANILASATSRSLVLLDEIGRGTATYDGVAIAWAVAEDLHDRVRCRGVFATHYHELAALTESCMRVRNFHVAVSEHQERVVFLRKVRPGPASGSYGIQCARLAGLPRPVVQRAGELLKQLERRRPRPEATQLSLFGAPAEPVAPPPAAPLSDPIREAVAGIDPDVLTPREALDALYRLRRLLDE